MPQESDEGQKFWSELVTQLSPYIPGEQRTGANVIKLNTNENPYPPSDNVMAAIANTAADSIRRYPNPQSTDLRCALGKYHNVSADNVFVGNGSDEILALAFMAFFKNSKPLQYPDISYSFYPVYCDLLDITPHTIALNNDFTIPLDKFGGSECGGIIFPNPNAPTAMAVNLDKDSFNSYPVDAIAEAAGIASLADETYYRQTIERIVMSREKTIIELNKRGFRTLPSNANFIFTTH